MNTSFIFFTLEQKTKRSLPSKQAGLSAEGRQEHIGRTFLTDTSPLERPGAGRQTCFQGQAHLEAGEELLSLQQVAQIRGQGAVVFFRQTLEGAVHLIRGEGAV